MGARDHVAVQQMGRELAKKLNIVPTPPDGDSSVEARSGLSPVLPGFEAHLAATRTAARKLGITER
jgi:hypothetical protein